MMSSKALKYTIKTTLRPSPQIYENLFVLDFEATCDYPEQISPQEIIEFPCLKVSGKTFEVLSQFHHYIRPICNPLLSDFCVARTGIIQEIIDNSETFESIFQQFRIWLHNNDFNNRCVFVTYGNQDFERLLPTQCQISNIAVPSCMRKWLDLKKCIARATGHYPSSLKSAVERFGIKFSGRQHSGIDDCYNMVSIMKLLAEKGYVFN
ncbi:ERI1 exoribonuclease 3-like [Schistocerca serialis cubense]|uniref:ERI1 exoribonuclease 3-like n=1 Tax=Schistocerca serialis cubense TaxID=2023355 RepID=UPI00214ECD25|nr:ERI1 exoribonuclease 3-like [Schistocerca serialis cubense]XP_049953716.1 ERI1 exoribonuclease 3-like [Schistocerca serialis cubense]